MDAAVKRIAPKAQCYQRRRPEKTLWYRTVQAHFETWLELAAGQGDASPPAHVEQAFRRYLESLLICSICHAQMRIIAFIDDASTVRKILDHIGESAQSPRIAPARGPPLWEAAMAHRQAGNDPQWDMVARPVPECGGHGYFDLCV